MTIITDQKIIIREDFEEEINKVRKDTKEKTLIPYRQWEADGEKQIIWQIPIDYCRFRADNGRISTDILSHSSTKKSIDQNSLDGQKLIKDFLGASDNARNEDLISLLKKDGQKEPAVITADGFLINGNRRKWALEKLYEDTGSDKFQYINVVILPGTGDPESPTLKDIALLEYRYQGQKTGKSEYTEMNKALRYRANKKNGLPLKAMLKDDAAYSNLDDKKFKIALKKFDDDHFGTLRIIDQYLSANKMEGNYKKVETKWDSFKELNQKVLNKLKDDKFLALQNIDSDEVGAIENACFNIMKLDDTKKTGGGAKVDTIREINKWIKNEKKIFLELSKVEDVSDEFIDEDEREKEWQFTQGEIVANTIKRLKALIAKKELQEGPLDRLEEALKKLDHKNLDEAQIKRMPLREFEKAMELCNSIQTASRDLHSIFWEKVKNFKDLGKKK